MQQGGSKAIKLPVGKLNEAVRKRLGQAPFGASSFPHTQSAIFSHCNSKTTPLANCDLMVTSVAILRICGSSWQT